MLSPYAKMITRSIARGTRHMSLALAASKSPTCSCYARIAPGRMTMLSGTRAKRACLPRIANYHVSPVRKAQGPTADALMEDLNDLYATAKDEFEIASEETEKKTVYAAEDREAAREALTGLQEAYDRATTESDPEVAKEVQSRVGPRIRELENAVKLMEERAMED